MTRMFTLLSSIQNICWSAVFCWLKCLLLLFAGDLHFFKAALEMDFGEIVEPVSRAFWDNYDEPEENEVYDEWVAAISA